MASFGGHALPGFFFILFGLWLAVRECLTYFSSLSRARFLKKDGTIILTLIGIGCFVELFWPFNGNHPPFGLLHDPGNPDQFFKPMNWQHFTMYIFFGFYGASRLLEHYIPNLFSGADRLAGGLAFFIEGYLFYNHVHGRSVLDSKIHMLIVLACFSSTLVWFVTFFLNDKRKVFILDVINASLMFAQGTWFWHVAIILYGTHPWNHSVGHDDHDETGGHHDHQDMADIDQGDDGMHDDHMVMDEEHVNTMFAVLFFTWHLAFAICFMIILATMIYQFLKRRGRLDHSFKNEENNNSYTKLANKDYQEATFDDNQTPLLQAVEEDENILFVKE